MITRYLALFDIHCGREWKRVRGQRIVAPTHCVKAISVALQVARDFQPHVLILGGDQINCGPVSHWHRGAPRLDERFRLRKEMDLLRDLVLDPFEATMAKSGSRRLIWHEGNHEQWIEQYLDANPAVEGLIEPREYLQLDKRGYEFYEQGETSSIGRVHFAHGDRIMGGKYAARRAVEIYRRNIRFGHHHSTQSATDTTPVDFRDYHTAIMVPALAMRGPSYAKNSPDNHLKGFLMGEALDNKEFSDSVKIINNNQLILNGKVYKG